MRSFKYLCIIICVIQCLFIQLTVLAEPTPDSAETDVQTSIQPTITYSVEDGFVSNEQNSTLKTIAEGDSASPEAAIINDADVRSNKSIGLVDYILMGVCIVLIAVVIILIIMIMRMREYMECKLSKLENNILSVSNSQSDIKNQTYGYQDMKRNVTDLRDHVDKMDNNINMIIEYIERQRAKNPAANTYSSSNTANVLNMQRTLYQKPQAPISTDPVDIFNHAINSEPVNVPNRFKLVNLEFKGNKFSISNSDAKKLYYLYEKGDGNVEIYPDIFLKGNAHARALTAPIFNFDISRDGNRMQVIYPGQARLTTASGYEIRQKGEIKII